MTNKAGNSGNLGCEEKPLRVALRGLLQKGPGNSCGCLDLSRPWDQERCFHLGLEGREPVKVRVSLWEDGCLSVVDVPPRVRLPPRETPAW